MEGMSALANSITSSAKNKWVILSSLHFKWCLKGWPNLLKILERTFIAKVKIRGHRSPYLRPFFPTKKLVKNPFTLIVNLVDDMKVWIQLINSTKKLCFYKQSIIKSHRIESNAFSQLIFNTHLGILKFLTLKLWG